MVIRGWTDNGRNNLWRKILYPDYKLIKDNRFEPPIVSRKLR